MEQQMSRFLVAVMVFAVVSPLVSAQIIGLNASLDPSAPAGIVTADIFINVAASDAWMACGLRAIAMNGATFRYGGQDDPNTPYPDYAVAPYGNNPVTDQHVTCFSRPRPNRSSANRFNSNAHADLHSRYDPPGNSAAIVASATELNLVWLANPLPGPSTPSEDGYFARVSMDV